jgi:hypothetical protein
VNLLWVFPSPFSIDVTSVDRAVNLEALIEGTFPLANSLSIVLGFFSSNPLCPVNYALTYIDHRYLGNTVTTGTIPFSANACGTNYTLQYVVISDNYGSRNVFGTCPDNDRECIDPRSDPSTSSSSSSSSSTAQGAATSVQASFAVISVLILAAIAGVAALSS